MEKKIITKHCRPEDRARMLKGHFKFGTLDEYTPRSGRSGGLYSDVAEGTGESVLRGDLYNASGDFFGMSYHDISTKNVDAAFSYTLELNYPVFCASLGPYKPERHRRLLNGTESYEGNPECTAFVMIDVDIFAQAAKEMAICVFGKCRGMFATRVKYGERSYDVPQHLLTRDKRYNNELEAFYRAAFTKPLNFSIEEEYRFVIVPAEYPKARQVFTRTLPNGIVNLFIRSICDEGNDTPRS